MEKEPRLFSQGISIHTLIGVRNHVSRSADVDKSDQHFGLLQILPQYLNALCSPHLSSFLHQLCRHLHFLRSQRQHHLRSATHFFKHPHTNDVFMLALDLSISGANSLTSQPSAIALHSSRVFASTYFPSQLHRQESGLDSA